MAKAQDDSLEKKVTEQGINEANEDIKQQAVALQAMSLNTIEQATGPSTAAPSNVAPPAFLSAAPRARGRTSSVSGSGESSSAGSSGEPSTSKQSASSVARPERPPPSPPSGIFAETDEPVRNRRRTKRMDHHEELGKNMRTYKIRFTQVVDDPEWEAEKITKKLSTLASRAPRAFWSTPA